MEERSGDGVERCGRVSVVGCSGGNSILLRKGSCAERESPDQVGVLVESRTEKCEDQNSVILRDIFDSMMSHTTTKDHATTSRNDFADERHSVEQRRVRSELRRVEIFASEEGATE